MPAALGGVGFTHGVTMGSQFAVLAVAVLSAALWSAGASFALVKFIEGIVGLRVVSETESLGLIAMIQPHHMDAVREGLNEAGIHGLTVSEVRGYGGSAVTPRFTAAPNTRSAMWRN
jgi:hypothetical protein